MATSFETGSWIELEQQPLAETSKRLPRTGLRRLVPYILRAENWDYIFNRPNPETESAYVDTAVSAGKRDFVVASSKPEIEIPPNIILGEN